MVSVDNTTSGQRMEKRRASILILAVPVSWHLLLSVADNFNLKIWNCDNGLPLSEIFSLDNVVVPKDNTGKFVFIPFDETVEVRDTFFVGWQKHSTSIIAVGFDLNTSTPNEKYFNIGNVWKKSNEIGQIMIRPSFGDIQTATNDIETTYKNVGCFYIKNGKDVMLYDCLKSEAAIQGYIIR